MKIEVLSLITLLIISLVGIFVFVGVIPCAQAEAIVFAEDFEDGIPYYWHSRDANYDNGYDNWDSISISEGGRVHGGFKSAWCAGNGDSRTVIFDEDAEGTISGWEILDWNLDNGNDYWGRIWTVEGGRVNRGSGSFWCAYHGNQYDPPRSNLEVHQYDDNMDARMYKFVGILSEYDYLELHFSCWVRTEYNSYTQPYGPEDYLQVLWYDGTWHWQGHIGGPPLEAGYEPEWTPYIVYIPTTATHVGFRFYSDPGVKYFEGAYVDDIKLIGYKENKKDHTYDDYMDAYMYRTVDLSEYESLSLSYWYWMDDADGMYDRLMVTYRIDGHWYFRDRKDSGTGSWEQSTTSIPNDADAVGFCFYSNEDNHNYEGAYVDDVVLSITFVPGVTPENFVRAIVQDASREYLEMKLGVQNFAGERLWEIGGQEGWWIEENIVEYTFDVSDKFSNLPPDEDNKWFVEVMAVSGNQAKITEFYLRYSDVIYSSIDPPVSINDYEPSTAYLPPYTQTTVDDALFVDMEASGSSGDFSMTINAEADKEAPVTSYDVIGTTNIGQYEITLANGYLIIEGQLGDPNFDGQIILDVDPEDKIITYVITIVPYEGVEPILFFVAIVIIIVMIVIIAYLAYGSALKKKAKV